MRKLLRYSRTEPEVAGRKIPTLPKRAKVSRMRIFVATATLSLTLLFPPTINADVIGPSTVSVAVQVFPCDKALGVAPTLRVDNLEAKFASVSVSPNWSRTESTWVGLFTVPAGHYAVYATSEHCAGESEQWVAIPGEPRHVAITLDKPPHVITLDENMFADAIYGRLPTPASRVEIMRADSIVGEQSRQVALLDGSSYQLGHLSAGSYIVRIAFGNVVVSREVIFPPHAYGFSIEADLTPEDGQLLVEEQESGSGFVDIPTYDHTKASTFQRGRAAADGWSTDPLLSPSDYSVFTQRLSKAVLRGLESAFHFLASDARIPKSFHSLSAWSVGISGNSEEVLVDLVPVDLAAWLRDGPKNPQDCLIFVRRHTIRLLINPSDGHVADTRICP